MTVCPICPIGPAVGPQIPSHLSHENPCLYIHQSLSPQPSSAHASRLEMAWQSAPVKKASCDQRAEVGGSTHGDTRGMVRARGVRPGHPLHTPRTSVWHLVCARPRARHQRQSVEQAIVP